MVYRLRTASSDDSSSSGAHAFIIALAPYHVSYHFLFSLSLPMLSISNTFVLFPSLTTPYLDVTRIWGQWPVSVSPSPHDDP